MKYWGLKNLSSQDAEIVDPPHTTGHAYPAGDKAKYRQWCIDEKTDHCFFSGFEGLTPSLRVTTANPPHAMYGLVVDYDAKITEGMVAAIADNAAADMLPRWISTTFSGGRRLIWEFEEPILVDHKDLMERFLKWLSKELKCNNIFPGLDKSSFVPTRYFELGKDWRAISTDVLKTDFLSLLVFKAANEKVITSGDTDVPMEIIAAEVERRFPNRWKGEFKTGARGPLFWIDDGIDRVGAQVGQFGMLCYSERAGKSFMSWREIFGANFLRDFEAQKIGAAADGIWFDGKSYWRKSENGDWRSRTKEDQLMWLRGQGVSGKTPPQGTISDAEKVLLAAQEDRTVAQAVPFVLDKREVITEGGYRFLNVAAKRTMMAMEKGEPAQFPWLHKFFNNVWDEEQRDHFLAWFQRFYVSGSQGRLAAGHAIFIAGEGGRGKTLLNQVIIGGALGGYADATTYLLGETRFNKECGENAMWCVDDAKGLESLSSKKLFAEAVKKQIATPRVHMEAKFRDSCTLPWAGRIGVTCNIDPDSLAIIPALDGTIADKIMLFKFAGWKPEFLPNAHMEALISKELPFFLAWLRDWTAPDYVLDKDGVRYGVKAYKHPDMIETAQEVSPHHGFEEALDIWARRRHEVTKEAEVELSGTELLCDIMQVEGLRGILKYYTAGNIGRTLRAMKDLPESRIKSYRRNKRTRLYTFDLT